MVNPPPAPFGRARPAAPASRPPVPPKRHVPAVAPAMAPPMDDPVAEELAAWQKTRAPQPFPWRQFSLVMGLSFGAASLVLPDTVNDAATYVLYALSALSFLGGIRRRRKKAS